MRVKLNFQQIWILMEDLFMERALVTFKMAIEIKEVLQY